MPDYQSIPINIAGPSYQDRSRALSSQQTNGFYHEVVESGKDKFVIKSFPGQKLLGSAAAAEDRGQHQMAEVGYRVLGTTLYEVSSTGVHTDRGIINGSSRCIFADDGVNLFIVADFIVNHYDSATNTVTRVTDANINGALSVDFINNRFLYTFPQLTVLSNTGDGSTASGLNAINEESNGDDLVRDYVFDQVIYRFGKRSCPNWWNSGVGTPPIERIEGQIINIGLGATHSVVNTKDYVYWLGSDNQIYRARGGQEKVMSTAAISGAIQSYSVTSDAFGGVFTIDDKTMCIFTFPTANKTWVLNEELGKDGWFELSEGVDFGRYNAGSILEVYNKVLVGDRSDGQLYELDFDTYDQAGETWTRRRVISSINGDALKQKGKRVQMSRLELIMEVGVGLISGQGEDPLIMIEASYDGGKSWSTGKWMRIGRQGETNIRAEWFNLKSFYDMIIRITTSDPVAYNIYSGVIDLKLAGR